MMWLRKVIWSLVIILNYHLDIEPKYNLPTLQLYNLSTFKLVFLPPMIIFNDTVIVDEAIHENWLKWAKQVHIPAVMATGYFKSYQILNVIDSPNEGVTYCVQYYADNIEDFNHFYNKHFHQLQAIHNKEFENQFVIFNTLMKTVD